MTTVALRDNRVASYSQTVPSRRTTDDEKRRNHLNSGYSGLDFRLMLPTSRTWAKKERIAMVSAVIGLVGGFIGATSGVLALWDRWRHRRPQLRLSIPVAFGDPTTLYTLLRISNNRRAAAPLYVETMKPYIRSNGKWHEVKFKMVSAAGKPIAHHSPKDDYVVWQTAIEEVGGLKRYTDNIVEFDRPLTGYIALVCPDASLLKSADAVKFLVEDCHGKTLTLQANLPRGERVH